ncbi:MAG: hypothetical protein Q4D19_09610 [Lautropia sp.]|nr:hypothetical protein [Lautropia sp.]
MFSFHPCTPDDKADWDAFVRRSRNGVFLFERSYMDYHADRFADASVIVHAAPDDGKKTTNAPARLEAGGMDDASLATNPSRRASSCKTEGVISDATGASGAAASGARSPQRKASEILAVLPAHRVERDGRTLFVSHGGLTFGGLVMAGKLGGHQVLHLFRALLPWLRAQGFDEFIYKATPHIYHRLPSEDDIYALHQLGAQTTQVQLSSTLDLQRDAPDSQQYRRALATARKAGIEVARCDFRDFWPVLTENLQTRHGVAPVHSLAEIELLANHFPDRIEAIGGWHTINGKRSLHGGAVLYHYDGVTHCQYLASSSAGHETLAQHTAVTAAIHQARAGGQRWFSFGTSTTEGGRLLNEGLLRRKEMFGARSTILQTLTLVLDERFDA